MFLLFGHVFEWIAWDSVIVYSTLWHLDHQNIIPTKHNATQEVWLDVKGNISECFPYHWVILFLQQDGQPLDY